MICQKNVLGHNVSLFSFPVLVYSGYAVFFLLSFLFSSSSSFFFFFFTSPTLLSLFSPFCPGIFSQLISNVDKPQHQNVNESAQKFISQSVFGTLLTIVMWKKRGGVHGKVNLRNAELSKYKYIYIEMLLISLEPLLG